MALSFYTETSFATQKYFLVISLCSFKLGRNKMPGVFGRMKNWDRQEKLCKLCDKQLVGDEFHYLLECPVFNDYRTRYLGRYYYSSNPMNVIKFKEAISPLSKKKMKNLAYF
jgi:hypothetical protein